MTRSAAQPPRVLYFCPDSDSPSGGIRVIYRHVDVLNDAGIPAAVLHPTPGFRCTWFEHDTRIADVATLSTQGAVVVIPEIYGPGIGGHFPGVRKVVFNQGAYLTFNGYSLDPHDLETPYLHPEVEAAIVVSEDNERYLRHAFPSLRLLRTVNSIDPELFHPAEQRRRRITFMPRRNSLDAVQVLSILKFRGALDSVEVRALEGLGEREVAAALHDSLIFLSLGTAEGCPMPPKEALASGCLAVGYHGLGGRDFFTEEIAYPVETGDVVAFATRVEELLLEHLGDPVPLPAKGRAAAAAIHARYSPERERESVLAAWEQILGAPSRSRAAASTVEEGPSAAAPAEETVPLASIAILTMNGLQHTRTCLESIERSTPEPHELIVVDNGSTDGTVEFLREYAATRPHVRLVVNAENKGFAGGNNQALALARGRYAVLLNNDTAVTPGWLAGLIAASERSGAALVGPVSNNVSGRQAIAAAYASAEDLDRFALERAASFAGRFEQTPRLVGFCLLFSRAVLDAVGALDERFGAGNFEDDDYCLRARIAGFGLAIAEDVFVHHTGSQTFLDSKIDHRASMARNAGVFAAKWGCSIDDAILGGPDAVDAERRRHLLHLPLPEAPVPAELAPAQGPRGELRVEEHLLRARDAVLGRDFAAVRAAFLETAGWDEPHRAHQAVRHLVELVLAAGERLHGETWVDLYEAAAGGVLATLEREPSEPVLLNAAGVLLYELTELEAAAVLFEAALRLDPKLEDAPANLAAAREPGRPRLERTFEPLARRARRVAAEAHSAAGLTLSLCMIVKDEEEMLPGCLAAAKDAVDEIVVVDTGSSDRTVEIAESFGAKVVRFPWNGSFADARNVSLDHASGDWIMYLDADEHLAEGSAPELRSLLGRTWREGFYLLETNFTGADDAGTAVAHPALRVFRHRPEYRFEGRIHEQKTRLMPTYLPERFETTSVRVSHYGYLKSRVDAKDKSRRNLELLADEPPSPFASFNLGSEYQMLGDWARAAEHFDEAWEGLHREPDWSGIGFAPILGLRLGRARRESGRPDEARAAFLEALEHWPEYTDLWFELAVSAQRDGDYEEAERLLRHCLELGDAPARYAGTVGAGTHIAVGVLGEVMHARGDLVEAERLYREALAEQPALSGLVLPLATLLLKRGVPAAELVHELPLSRPQAALLAATACLQEGQPAEAESLLRGLLARQPDNGPARVALLEALTAQRRYAEVVREAAAVVDPSVAGVAATASLFARATAGDSAGLAAALDAASRAPLRPGELDLYRAWSAALAGGSAPGPLAAECFEPALEALEALLRLQEFEAFERLLAIYERIAVTPDERRARLAAVYLRRGYVDSAEEEWRRGELDSSALVGLAQIALVRERPGEAAARAAEALARDPSSEAARRLVDALAA